MHSATPLLQWQRERCNRCLWGGTSVAATPLLHTQNCGMSRDRGVATPWSARGGGVLSSDLGRQLRISVHGPLRPPLSALLGLA